MCPCVGEHECLPLLPINPSSVNVPSYRFYVVVACEVMINLTICDEAAAEVTKVTE